VKSQKRHGKNRLRKDFIDHLFHRAKRDPRIVLLTGDLGYNVLEEFQEEMPDQFYNLGIAEQSLLSIAAGMAKKGLRPFVYSIGNFPTMRCLEQIRNDVVFMQLPVTVVALGAGFAYGTSGYSHYLIEDFSALSAFSIDIYSPEGPGSAKVALEKVLESNKPAYIRLGRGHERNSQIAIQSMKVDEIVIPPATDVVFLSFGPIADEVDSAIQQIGEKNISAIHITVGAISNLNLVLKAIAKSNVPIITVEEHVLRGGFGSLVLEMNQVSSLKLLRIGVGSFDNEVMGSQEFMRQHYGLSAKSIEQSALKFLSDITNSNG